MLLIPAMYWFLPCIDSCFVLIPALYQFLPCIDSCLVLIHALHRFLPCIDSCLLSIPSLYEFPPQAQGLSSPVNPNIAEPRWCLTPAYHQLLQLLQAEFSPVTPTDGLWGEQFILILICSCSLVLISNSGLLIMQLLNWYFWPSSWSWD